MTARKTRNDEVQELEETREDHTHAELDEWTPPSVLEAPPARQGYRQRWVSTSILGNDIPHHTMRRLREGWTPRPKDSVPSDWPVATIAHGQYEGYIGVEGMILCEMPLARVAKREEYFRKKGEDQAQFVDASLNKVEREGGVAIDRTTNRQISKGRRPDVADD